MTHLKTKFKNLLAAPEMLRLYIASGYWIVFLTLNLLARILPHPLNMLLPTMASVLMMSSYAIFFPIIIFFSIRAVMKGKGNHVNNIGTLLLTVPGSACFFVATAATFFQK